MKIGIYGRLLPKDEISFVQSFFNILQSRDIEFIVHMDYYNKIRNEINFEKDLGFFKDHSDIAGKIDYLFSLGGDGTILDTLTLVRDSNIPIIGINLGRLGFLASIGKEDIEKAITDIEKGSFVLDTRSLIRLESNKPLFGDVNYALNEFTIHKKDSSGMVIIHTYINGDYLCTYWADGIIVSTPTGSTGYSLSCGGPIIFPKSENFVITPISPHNLNVRPIIVSNDHVISFEIKGRAENFLCTLDARTETINSSIQLAVKKEDFSIDLIRLNDENFLNTLRNKMNWGLDERN